MILLVVVDYGCGCCGFSVVVCWNYRWVVWSEMGVVWRNGVWERRSEGMIEEFRGGELGMMRVGSKMVDFSRCWKRVSVITRTKMVN